MTDIKRTLRGFASRCSILSTVALASLAAMYDVPAAAQNQPNEQALQQLPADLAERVRNIALLPDEFRRKPLEQLIADYPNTDAARWAQQLLDAYALQARLEDARRQMAELRTQQIRTYWDLRRPPAPPVPTHRITLDNRSDDLVVYELKYPYTEWLGPYAILPGSTRELGDTVMLRQLSADRVESHTLHSYQHYEFRSSPGGGPPTLNTVPSH